MKIETFEVMEEQEGERLDKFLSIIYPDTSRSFFQKLIKDSGVLVNDKAEKASYRMCFEDVVTIHFPDAVETTIEPENIPLDIVFEDEDIIVINKPSGMVVHPAPGNESGTLVNALLYHCKGSLSGINGVVRPGIVHRIDKDTSGLLVVAKNDESHVFLSSLLKDHGIKRVYHAIVVGHYKEVRGTVDAPIARHPVDRKKMAVVAGGREAITHYEVIEEYPSFTYARFQLETGRTHQIRVHTSYIGHPIIGDLVYGGGKTAFEKNNKALLDGQILHAKILSFPHPRTKETVTFECELPDNFKMLLERLR